MADAPKEAHVSAPLHRIGSRVLQTSRSEALEERCEQLRRSQPWVFEEPRSAPDRRQIEETKSSYTKEQLEKRLAKLVGGVALIKAVAWQAARKLQFSNMAAGWCDNRD